MTNGLHIIVFFSMFYCDILGRIFAKNGYGMGAIGAK